MTIVCIICLDDITNNDFYFVECCKISIHVICSEAYVKSKRDSQLNCPHCRFPMFITITLDTKKEIYQKINLDTMINLCVVTNCSDQYMHILNEYICNNNCSTKSLNVNKMIYDFTAVNDERVYTMLIKNGADVNTKRIFENTPLHSVLIKRMNPIPLLKLGACVDIQNDMKMTPLHLAFKHCDTKTILAVLDYATEESIMIKDCKGNTILHYASMAYTDVKLKLLIRKFKNLDVNNLNKYKTSPLNIAIKCGNSRALITLLKHGASVCTRMNTIKKEVKYQSNVTILEYINIIKTNMIFPIYVNSNNMNKEEYVNTLPIYIAVLGGMSRQAIDALVHAYVKEKVLVDGNMINKCILYATLGQTRTIIKNYYRFNIINKINIPSYLMKNRDILLIQKCDLINRYRPYLMKSEILN